MFRLGGRQLSGRKLSVESSIGREQIRIGERPLGDRRWCLCSLMMNDGRRRGRFGRGHRDPNDSIFKAYLAQDLSGRKQCKFLLGLECLLMRLKYLDWIKRLGAFAAIGEASKPLWEKASTPFGSAYEYRQMYSGWR